MKVVAFIIGLSAVMLNSCTDNLNEVLPDSEQVVLTGNRCEAARAASTDSPSYLPAGSPILVNATGGLTLANEVLTYRNQRWEAEIPLQLDRPATPTRLTALYPAQDPSHYTTAHLYADGRLNDVLCAQHTFQPGDRFHLRFKHLFAQLSLKLSPELQNGLQQLEITCPHRVGSIDAATATITLDPQKPHTTVCQPQPAGQRYTLLVPPGNATTFTLRLVTANRTLATTLTVARLESGHTYAYTLQPQKQEQGPGIATVEDWIAFKKLIENPSLKTYQGKTLNDFRKMVDGVPTYYLLNDLDFSQVADSRINLSIGDNTMSRQGWQGVFDGRGHTLSNLTIHCQQGSLGIFSGIGHNSYLKNLRVRNCTAILQESDTLTDQGIGILTGYNNGHILNCHLADCRLQATLNRAQVASGGLTGMCTGRILNSSVQQVHIQSRSSNLNQQASGGLAGYLQKGKILNCFVANSRIDNQTGMNGGLCGSLFDAILMNCYTYRTTLPQPTSGILVGSAQTESVAKYNYYESSNQQPEIYEMDQSCTRYINYNSPYNASCIIQKGIQKRIDYVLNIWVTTLAREIYPQYTFTLWQAGENPPAVWDTSKV